MTMRHESDEPANFLLRDFLALETPEGYREFRVPATPLPMERGDGSGN
jgi:hypothetical protein